MLLLSTLDLEIDFFFFQVITKESLLAAQVRKLAFYLYFAQKNIFFFSKFFIILMF